MIQDLTDSPDFKPDYKNLGLDDRASWQDARASYKRLVHRWHPDKYASRPRERVHAQQQFISLTKSYDNLRVFQRNYGRLPFQPLSAATSGASPIRSAAKNTTRHSAPDTARGDTFGRDAPGKDKAASDKRSMGKFWWLASGFAMLLSTLVFFMVLDRKANMERIERGREVIRQTPPSNFMPSPSEIRKSEAKGSFVQPPR